MCSVSCNIYCTSVRPHTRLWGFYTFSPFFLLCSFFKLLLRVKDRGCQILLSPMRQIVTCEYGLFKYNLIDDWLSVIFLRETWPRRWKPRPPCGTAPLPLGWTLSAIWPCQWIKGVSESWHFCVLYRTEVNTEQSISGTCILAASHNCHVSHLNQTQVMLVVWNKKQESTGSLHSEQCTCCSQQIGWGAGRRHTGLWPVWWTGPWWGAPSLTSHPSPLLCCVPHPSARLLLSAYTGQGWHLLMGIHWMDGP